MIRSVATREAPGQRGRRRGLELQAKLLSELRQARITADISQREMAARLGWSQAEYWRFENNRVANLAMPDIGAAAALLGFDLSSALHPAGDAIADRGQQSAIARLRGMIGTQWKVFAEALLPGPGDKRSWDLLLRLGNQIVGIEVETKVRDIQALVRKIRARQRDGGTDEIVLVLADTRTNRRLVTQLREALGPQFATPPSGIRAALQAGRPVPGSGVLLI